MPAPRATEWRPAAAYLYVLHLDGPSLAWEYLRRNPDYRLDWQRFYRRLTGRRPWRWGLRLYEDPGRDARAAQPDWEYDPEDLVWLQPDDDPSPDAPSFRLWRFPGYKVLLHDGRRLLLAAHRSGQVQRLALASRLADGMAYAYAIHADTRLRRRWRALEAQLAVLEAEAPDAYAATRPGRTLLAHMRSLQALDGVLAGATQREIARVLFGERAVRDRWHDDSELRAQVRHLIRRGRAYMAGEYRRLLRLVGHAPGDERSSAESP